MGATPGLRPPALSPRLLPLPHPPQASHGPLHLLFLPRPRPRTWRTAMSFCRRKGLKPFLKTRWTLNVCRVRSCRRRLCAPSTTRTDRWFLGRGDRR